MRHCDEHSPDYIFSGPEALPPEMTDYMHLFRRPSSSTSSTSSSASPKKVSLTKPIIALVIILVGAPLSFITILGAAILMALFG